MKSKKILCFLLSVPLFYSPLLNFWTGKGVMVDLMIYIALLIISIIYILFFKKSLVFNKSFDTYNIYLYIFSLLLVFSFLYSEQQIFNYEKFNGYLFSIVLPALIIILFFKLKFLDVKYLFQGAYFIGIILTITSFYFMLSTGAQLNNPNGFYFLEGNRIETGRLFGFHIIVAIYMFIITKNKLFKSFIVVNIFLDFIFVFAAGTRQIILSLTILLVIALVILAFKSLKKFSILIFIGIVMSIIFSSSIINILSDTLLFQRLNDNFFESESRSYLYQEGLNLIIQNLNTFIFGIGFGDYVFESMYTFPYPHNLLLEVFIELGLLGGILLILLILTPIRFTFILGIKKNDVFMIFLLMMYSYVLLNSLVSFNINGNNLVFLIGLLIMANIKRHRHENII